MDNNDFVTAKKGEIIIVCPKCNSDYVVFKSDLLRPRELKCAECGYSWLHSGINGNKKDERVDLKDLETSILEHEDDPRGDFDYPEDEELDEEWLSNKNRRDPSESGELDDEDLLEKLDEIDDNEEEEVVIQEETEDETEDEMYDSESLPLELLGDKEEKFEDNSFLKKDQKDDFDDLLAELDDIDDEDNINEADTTIEEDEDNSINSINPISSNELQDEIKDTDSFDNDIQTILPDIKRDSFINPNFDNNQEKFNDLDVGSEIVKNDYLIEQKSSIDMDEFEDDNYEDEYEEEYKEQSLFSRLLNYALMVVTPIVFISFLLTTSLNFYNSMPNFVKYSLSIIGIQNLSGLRFIDLKPHLTQTNDSGLNLVIEGTIANVSDEVRNIPKIQIKLFDKFGVEHGYETILSKSSLKSMEYEKFTYRIFAIDFEPTKVDVSLVNGINKYVKYKSDK